jgi:acyl carrier protein
MADDDQLRTAVLDVLKQIAPEVKTASIDPNRTFRDQMGLDSIDFLNFIAGLEERMKVRIAETDYPQLSCLRGCLDYLAAHAMSAQD